MNSLIALSLFAVLWVLLRWYKKLRPKRSSSRALTASEADTLWQNVQRMPSKDEEEILASKETIVGITKPVGFWTRKVIGEKMEFLIATLNMQEDNRGYWQAYVSKRKAQEKDTTKPMR